MNTHTDELETLQQRCYDICRQRGWKRDWSSAGCYLHLEVSEFIEALRGKKGEPAAEAADVLFVLLSTMKEYHLTLAEVTRKLAETCGEQEKNYFTSRCPLCGNECSIKSFNQYQTSLCNRHHWWHRCVVHNTAVRGRPDISKLAPNECSCHE